MKTGDAHIKRQIFGREVVVAVTRTEQQRLFSISLSLSLSLSCLLPFNKGFFAMETTNQLIIVIICSLSLYSLFSLQRASWILAPGNRYSMEVPVC